MTVSLRPLSWFEKRESKTEQPPWNAGQAPSDRPSTSVASGEASALPEDEESCTVHQSGTMPVVVESPELQAERDARAALEVKLADALADAKAAREQAMHASELAASLQQSVEQAHQAMRHLVETMRNDAERELVRLALGVAQQVIAQQMAIAPEVVVQWARDAIDSSAIGDEFEIALAADVAERVPVPQWAELGPLVTTDPMLAPGTCEIREGGKVITVDAATRLGLVEEHLAQVNPSERQAA